MKDNILAANSVNTTEDFATPMRINLQLFAEGDPTPSADPVETDPAPSTDPTPTDPAPSSDPIPNADPTPDLTQTQAFSQRLKESTQKAIDQEYDRLYGTEYGIHSKAEYDKAIADQKADEERQQFQEQNGFDPDTVKPLFEEWKKSDPDFQELSYIRQEKNITAALSDLNNELKDCGMDLQLKDLSDAEVAKIPNADKVTELVSKGKTLSEAFFLANKKDIISKQTQAAQQETLKKIADNKASSPGSLSGGGENLTTFTMEQIQKMSQEQINQNYEAVMASYKKLRG